MTSKANVEDFIQQRKLAVVGVSRKGKKFGNRAYRTLREQGYELYPVHPQADVIEGDRAYPSLSALPEPVDGVFVCVPPTEAEKVLEEAAASGIRRIWLQQGSESEAAVRRCQALGLSEVHGECILMFTEPAAWGHRAHRWVWHALGKLPR